MPVMKQLNVGGVTYDTVGEASVTQVVSSGTKIATVSIDGTSTDLYAPSGGSSVEPATAAPIVDGTAAVGTSVKYAREDHVHPTDTSRAAATHTHAIADVTSLQTTLDGKAASMHLHAASDVASGTLDVARIPTGTTSGTVALGDHTHSGYAPTSHEHSGAAITSGTVGFSYLPTGTGASQVAVGNHTHSGYQATLVSGTNIKTINSTSLLGSGDIAIDVPTASTTNPSMDGTASYGSGTSYARSNHVHPTDTSRAASTHDHGSITNEGAITSDTAAASGDKLVIADSSDSSKLKRSGIAFGSSTSTFLRNDGTWATPSGGGGGGSWTDVTSAFENAGWEPDYVVFIALSDGKSVMICGTIATSEYVLGIPSIYAPFSCTYIAACTNMNGQLSCPPIADSIMGEEFTFNTGIGTEGEMFTVTYPLLSAVN